MSGRNGGERAPRPAINGFFGQSGHSAYAHIIAQCNLTYFRARRMGLIRIQPAFPGEFPRALRLNACGRTRRVTVHVLAAGTLIRAPEARTATCGRKYVKATLRAGAVDTSGSPSSTRRARNYRGSAMASALPRRAP